MALRLYQVFASNLRNVVRNTSSSSTIFSLSSGYGKCGVSVIRVSGPSAKNALQALVADVNFKPQPRYANLKSLYHPQSREVIDKGLVLWFPAPASFTGEDCCEFQVHGSVAVVAALLEALGQLPGMQPAQPGEFTKRAFFGGKMDLTEVDGLADLIHAETEAQRRQALLQASGALSRLYANWRERLIRCVAHLEAFIDFAEDENIEHDVIHILMQELQQLQAEIQKHLNDQRCGERLRDGVRTAIVGAPNVGKSSFLNLMCQKELSIVTPLAGTTRDVIVSTYNIAGYPVIFADMAGLRTQTADIVEQEGMNRARECVENADIVLLLTDASKLAAHMAQGSGNLAKYKQDYLQELGIEKSLLLHKKLLFLGNKMDLLTTEQLQVMQQSNIQNSLLLLSCKQATGLKAFLNIFEQQLVEICGQPTAENPRITQTRYRQQLELCVQHLQTFLSETTADVMQTDVAIAARKLRQAVKCIERINGRVSTDDILDVVFRDFCIGK